MSYEGQRRPRNFYERTDSGRHSKENYYIKWLLGMVSTLLVAGVLGAWQQAITLAELRAEVRNLQREISELKAWVGFQRRERGGNDAN